MPVMSTDTPAPVPGRLRSLRPAPAGAEQLRAEVARLERRLQEQTGELTYWWDRQHPWGFDPFDFQRGGFGTGFGFPADRGQDRTHAPLPYLTESEYRFGVACNRDLLASNHLAIGFLDHVARFIGPVSVSFVLRGGAPGSSASGPVDADGDGEQDAPPEVVAATEVWEEWCEENDWGQGETDREYECLRRLIGEGETTLEWFLGARGRVPQVRHVEPELIRPPVGGYGGYGWACPGDWSLGVLTRPNDVETDLAIWVSDPDGTDGRVVEADRFTRARNNVDRCIKRGLSDFFPVAELLRKLSGLSDNMAHVARLQAAIAWWEQYPTATESQVRSMIEAGRDYQAVRPAGFGPTAGANAGAANVRKYDAGSVVRTESGRQVMPGPTATPGGFVQVAELVMGGVSFRFGLPKSFSGDSDSFASALVSGSPFVRIIEGRQEKQKGFTRAVVLRALALAEESGRLPAGVARRVKPVLSCKPVVIADEEKKARTFLALYEKNCADPTEYIRSAGGDPKVVAANISAWKKKFPDPNQPPPPGGSGGGGDQPPAGPNATPPGSAGGDGSSPNADPFGESKTVREAAPGPPPRPGLVWNDSTHRWRNPDTGEETPHPSAQSNPQRAAAELRTGDTWAHMVARVKLGDREPTPENLHRVLADTRRELTGTGEAPDPADLAALDKMDALVGATPPAGATPAPRAAAPRPVAYPPGYAPPHGDHNVPNERLPDAARPRLTPAEARAVQDYATEAYFDINDALRRGKSPPAKYTATHAALRAAFAKARPFPAAVPVRRGLDLKPRDAARFAAAARAALETGAPVTQPGYVSTTTDTGGGPVASHWHEKSVQVHIAAVHGLDARPYSEFTSERELILDHNSRFRVTGVEQKGDQWHIRMEQIPPTNGPAPTGGAPTSSSGAPTRPSVGSKPSAPPPPTVKK